MFWIENQKKIQSPNETCKNKILDTVRDGKFEHNQPYSGLWIQIFLLNIHVHTFSGRDSKIHTVSFLNDHRLNILQVIQPPKWSNPQGWMVLPPIPTSGLVSRWTSQWRWTWKIWRDANWFGKNEAQLGPKNDGCFCFLMILKSLVSKLCS